MGVFFICWAPFFVTNVLFGICNTKCVLHADIIFPIVTWLGYINSGMNPIIYACSMRDFRRSFTKVICCFSSRRCNRKNRQRNSFMYRNSRGYQDAYIIKNTHREIL
jgi:hypothetical protein